MRSFTELSLKERFELLYKLLAYIKKHKRLSSKRLRLRFAKANNLTEYTVKRMVNFLWFGDIIKVVYRGVPPRPFYALTDLGESIILKGKIEVKDFFLAPEWVKRALTRKVRKKVIRILTILVKGWKFSLSENWKYKLEVETPSRWLHKWQSSIFGREYSVKHRSIVLLETLGIAPRYFAGYKFVKLSKEAIEKRIKAGKMLKVWRTLMYDPENLIDVKRISRKKGRVSWEVDFSALSESLPETLDLEDIRLDALGKGYRAG